MMDWTDDLKSAFHIKRLNLPENPCHLYGTSNFRRFVGGRLGRSSTHIETIGERVEMRMQGFPVIRP